MGSTRREKAKKASVQAPGAAARLSPVVSEHAQELRERGEAYYERADTRSRGILSIGRTALTTFMGQRATSSAAGLSYYALFSLFPIILFAVTLVGSVVGYERVIATLDAAVQSVLPVGGDIVHTYLTQTTPASLGFKVFSAILLLWSASSFFVGTTMYIGQAWEPLGARPSTLRERGLGLLAVLILMLLLVAIVVANMMLSVALAAPALFPSLRGLLGPLVEPLVTWVVPPLLIWGLLSGLFMLAPSMRVWPPAALWGAGLAALAWQVMSKGFGWWVNRGMEHYQRIYGSLAAVITLLLWMYASAVIVLAGAHLCAAIQMHRGPAQKAEG